MNNTIIPYCTAGIGNRLRTIASCGVIAEETGRKLRVYWDNKQMNGCLAPLNELFKNDIDVITLEELSELEDCHMTVEKYDADREEWEFGVPVLKNLTNKFGAKGKNTYNHSITNKNIIVFNISFLNNVDLNKSYKFIQNLKPTDDLQKEIDSVVGELSLSKDIIGIHARGSDFNVPVQHYITQIEQNLNVNPNQMFYLSTEDKNYENIIKDRFKNNVLVRDKKHYINRFPNTSGWSHKTFKRDIDHAKEAIVDMFILSKTNIKIYHQGSTYTEICRIISNKNE